MASDETKRGRKSGTVMDVLKTQDFVRLIEVQAPYCVSIYLPTHRSLPEARQDPIRFKNMLRQSERELEARGVRASEIAEFLEPAQRLLDDPLFWRYQSDGLAVFKSPTEFFSYRLPVKFKELLVVSSYFHVKPLLPLLASDGHFFVLALSKNEVRLIESTRYGASEAKLENIPNNLAEVLGEYDPETQLQFHTGAQQAGDKRAAVFHGHGGGSDDLRPRIAEYFRRVDSEVRLRLTDDNAPLVLAGVGSLMPIYRETNTYGNLLQEVVEGNPESLTGAQLRERALPLVEPQFDQSRREDDRRYCELAGTGRTSNDLQEILIAAHDGRVEVFFVAVDRQIWGAFDDQTRTVTVHETAHKGDRDLLDLCAVLTVGNRGSVHVAPEATPDTGPLAAVFRY